MSRLSTTIHGIQFEVEAEPADYWKWIRDGSYDREWEAYDEALKPWHTFIDLGAWVGAHSLYASKKAKKVWALEPDPVAFEILKKNAIGAFIVENEAIAGHLGKITLGSGLLGASTTRKNLAAGRGIGAAEQTCECGCMTLRDFVQLLHSTTDGHFYPFLKIDIEGSDEFIFPDFALFSEYKPAALIELHPFWWADEAKTRQEFEAIKTLYASPRELFGNTWLLV